MPMYRCLITAGLAFAAACAQAGVVQLDFTGTYDTAGSTVFGQSGSAVSYHYTISYDTALNTNSLHVASGDPLGAETAANDFYGYAKSGIVASSLTFGTQTWTAADLLERTLAPGISADLWFDTDISVGAPTLAYVFLSNASGSLMLGGAQSDGSSVNLQGDATVTDTRGGSYSLGRGPMDITLADAGGTLPEPGTLALVACGLLAAARRTAQRGSRRPPGSPAPAHRQAAYR